MIKMEDCEVDSNDRPLFPPKIKKTEVWFKMIDLYFLKPFNFQEWLRQNVFLQFRYNIEQKKRDENKESY